MPRRARESFRNAVFASLIALGVAGAAQAQAPSTRDLAGHLPGGNAGNVVGGRSATIVGGGDNLAILYDEPGAGGGAGWSPARERATRRRRRADAPRRRC